MASYVHGVISEQSDPETSQARKRTEMGKNSFYCLGPILPPTVNLAGINENSKVSPSIRAQDPPCFRGLL